MDKMSRTCGSTVGIIGGTFVNFATSSRLFHSGRRLRRAQLAKRHAFSAPCDPTPQTLLAVRTAPFPENITSSLHWVSLSRLNHLIVIRNRVHSFSEPALLEHIRFDYFAR